MPKPPPAVAWIVETLEDAGFDTWVVGGAIRDGLLEIAHEDWDLATKARPEDVQRLFRRTVPIGIEHGTVGVLSRDRTLFEVTTFRRDVENLGRRAVVEFADRIDQDLARRDFTINAIAWHPIRDELKDPFHGLEDLRARRLRTVGEARERFSEDYLRVLRALRFAGRYGLAIEPSTWTALCTAVPQLTILSAERIREELLKVITLDPAPSGALSLYAASGALEVVLPELTTVDTDPNDRHWALRSLTIDGLSPSRPLLRLAALLSGLDHAQTAAVLTRLRFSNAQVRTGSDVVEALRHRPVDSTPEGIRRWLSRIGPSNLRPWVRIEAARCRVARAWEGAGANGLAQIVRTARAELATNAPLTTDMLSIDGRDLIGLGLRPGPAFGRILAALLDLTLADPSLNTPTQLRDLARELAVLESDASDKDQGG